ncbi:hypothetical protein ED733_006496 [Metarhizium rileyi]|uniref:FAD linked oxidase N-terminal domain-containing protein n=1 Tax=Metarhizium rileyi (strain RCEF 4871) TaxID=1649241 RepID=A0A5C6GBY2_METRR|nr:hypothetical protein ED733_006496 [Metarhizium rileyi]
MDKIVAFHIQDMDVVAQPGIHWTNLNNDISSSGLFVPPNPGPIALVGEMVSTNCSADGSVIKTRNRPRKASAGYNLNGLFAGSEGT